MIIAATAGIDLPLLLVGLTVDLVAITLIMGLGYYRLERNAGYLFTLVLVNVLVFLVTHLMLVADLSAGVGFGMFALFGIMRFRTATLPIQEMTYLFTAIVVAVANGVSVDLLSAAEVAVINILAVATVLVLSVFASSKPTILDLTYDRAENLAVGRRAELIEDLETRLGIEIVGLQVERVNLLNDTAELRLSITPNERGRSLGQTSGVGTSPPGMMAKLRPLASMAFGASADADPRGDQQSETVERSGGVPSEAPATNGNDGAERGDRSDAAPVAGRRRHVVAPTNGAGERNDLARVAGGVGNGVDTPGG